MGWGQVEVEERSKSTKVRKNCERKRWGRGWGVRQEKSVTSGAR